MRILIALLLLAPLAAAEDTPSAFRFKKDSAVKAGIDTRQIRQGVRSNRPDPRDVIPAIRKPESVGAGEAHWLRSRDRVLGVVVKGKARAYPLKILERHEMVNDVLGGVPIGPNY